MSSIEERIAALRARKEAFDRKKNEEAEKARRRYYQLEQAKQTVRDTLSPLFGLPLKSGEVELAHHSDRTTAWSKFQCLRGDIDLKPFLVFLLATDEEGSHWWVELDGTEVSLDVLLDMATTMVEKELTC